MISLTKWIEIFLSYISCTRKRCRFSISRLDVGVSDSGKLESNNYLPSALLDEILWEYVDSANDGPKDEKSENNLLLDITVQRQININFQTNRNYNLHIIIFIFDQHYFLLSSWLRHNRLHVSHLTLLRLRRWIHLNHRLIIYMCVLQSISICCKVASFCESISCS
jgi:hypothetical protein